MRRRRTTKPSEEILDRITAAAAAGLTPEVDRLSALAQLQAADAARNAVPLPIDKDLA